MRKGKGIGKEGGRRKGREKKGKNEIRGTGRERVILVFLFTHFKPWARVTDE